MKKIIIVVLGFLILGTVIPTYHLVKTTDTLNKISMEFADNQARGERLSAELTESKEEKERLSTELAGSEEERERVSAHLTDSRAESKRLSAELATSDAVRDLLYAELTGSKEEKERLSTELAGSEEERERLSAELAGSEEEKNLLFAELAKNQTEKERLSAELRLKKILISYFKGRLGMVPAPTQNAKVEVKSSEIRKLILGEFPRLQEEHILFSDNRYLLTSRREWERFLAADTTDQKRYQGDFFDCDDYAAWLVGAANVWAPEYVFGQMWIYTEDFKVGHAINFFISEEKEGQKIWFVEPQNDQIYGSIKEMGFKFATLIIV